MDKMALTYRVCFKQLDENQIAEFLYLQKDELLLPDRSAAVQVMDLLFEKGGVMGGFDRNGNMQAILGFLFGDPSEEFSDKETLFFYVAALAKPYRQTRAFYKGLMAVLYQGKGMGVDRFKMQAGLSNRYINRLYSKFGQPLGESTTLRGQPVMTYGGSLTHVISQLEARSSTGKQTLGH